MSVTRQIYKKFRFVCFNDHKFTNMQWDYEPLPQCPECGSPTATDDFTPGESAAVIGDEIDVTVRHGLCYDDGTPRRFTSMTELRRVAQEKGLTISGETPKPTSQQREKEARYQEELRKRRGF